MWIEKIKFVCKLLFCLLPKSIVKNKNYNFSFVVPWYSFLARESGLRILYSASLQAHANSHENWEQNRTQIYDDLWCGAIWHDPNLAFTLNWYWPKSQSCQQSKKSDWIRNQFWSSPPDSFKKWIRKEILGTKYVFLEVGVHPLPNDRYRTKNLYNSEI